DLSTGKLLGLLYGVARIYALTWAPDGSELAMCTDEGAWLVPTDGSARARPIGSSKTGDAAFPASGRYVGMGFHPPFDRTEALVLDRQEGTYYHIPCSSSTELAWAGDRLVRLTGGAKPCLEELRLDSGAASQAWLAWAAAESAPPLGWNTLGPTRRLLAAGDRIFAAPIDPRRAAVTDTAAVVLRVDLVSRRVWQAPLGIRVMDRLPEFSVSPDGRWLAVTFTGVDEEAARMDPAAADGPRLLLFEAVDDPRGLVRRGCIALSGTGVTAVRPSWSPDSHYMVVRGLDLVDIKTRRIVCGLHDRVASQIGYAEWTPPHGLIVTRVGPDESGIYLTQPDSPGARLLFETQPIMPARGQSFVERLLRALRGGP
ncbi:MAG TPA: hypothetical protein PLQ54_07525, partial [Armatimonadota bacterium]|nr:hypothetical protein [Armatimonadota bacterium]